MGAGADPPVLPPEPLELPVLVGALLAPLPPELEAPPVPELLPLLVPPEPVPLPERTVLPLPLPELTVLPLPLSDPLPLLDVVPPPTVVPLLTELLPLLVDPELLVVLDVPPPEPPLAEPLLVGAGLVELPPGALAVLDVGLLVVLVVPRLLLEDPALSLGPPAPELLVADDAAADRPVPWVLEPDDPAAVVVAWVAPAAAEPGELGDEEVALPPGADASLDAPDAVADSPRSTGVVTGSCRVRQRGAVVTAARVGKVTETPVNAPPMAAPTTNTTTAPPTAMLQRVCRAVHVTCTQCPLWRRSMNADVPAVADHHASCR